MKTRKYNVKKILLGILVLILIVVGVLFAIKKLTKEESKQPTVNIIDNALKYTLDDNETAYYKNLFGQLKTVLNESPVNMEKYASLISQLFISDFFTLNNKVTKNDVGGTQFVYTDYQSDFEAFAKESIYSNVKNNLSGNRNQKLPIVHSVDITNIVQKEYTYLDKTDEEAYFIDLQITYDEDLGYQKNATLILIHNDEWLEIVKMENE